MLVPQTSEIALLGGLALAVAPLALIAAMKPSLSVAPITAIIVLLVPTITLSRASPYASALDRVLEVALGGVTGFIVSLLVFPSNAHLLVVGAAAAGSIRWRARLTSCLPTCRKVSTWIRSTAFRTASVKPWCDSNVMGTEAEHERAARLAAGPETGPLLRTLLRLRHDLVMIGRAAVTPLPEASRCVSTAAEARGGAAFADYLRGSAAALLARRDPPSLRAVELALDAIAVKSPRSGARASRAVLPARRRNASSLSDSRSSRCTAISTDLELRG